MGLKDFNIITGIDGDYVIKNNVPVKIKKVSRSPNWNDGTGGAWVEYELADGERLKINSSIEMNKLNR